MKKILLVCILLLATVFLLGAEEGCEGCTDCEGCEGCEGCDSCEGCTTCSEDNNEDGSTNQGTYGGTSNSGPQIQT